MSTQKEKVKKYKNREKKIVNVRHIRKLSEKLKKDGKKIVFTTGGYDMLHPGHCRYLTEAKSRGDILVVGVAPDNDDRKLKGYSVYPIIKDDIRMELLSHLRSVDYVVRTPEDAPHAILALLQPDIYFTSEYSWIHNIRDQEEVLIVHSYGGKVIKRKIHEPYISTPELVNYVADIRILQILEGYLKNKLSGFSLDPNIHLQPLTYKDQTPKYRNAFNSYKLIVNFDDLEKLHKKYKSKRKKTVFVSGSYDLIHVGHARFVEQAGMNGDILIVGIPSDNALRGLKGIGRPVISERDRAYILGHLEYVDHVVIFDEPTILSTLRKLKPDVFFTVQEEWNSGLKKSPEYKCVKGYNGDVVTSKRKAPFVSASAIIDKMAVNRVQEIFGEFIKEEKIERLAKESSFPEN